MYSSGPVAIDSTLLFTCVKKQMALADLMLGGKEDGSGFMLVWFWVCFLYKRLVFYLPSSLTACLLSPSPSLSRLSSASSQPCCRQEVRPCHSALPDMSAGSPNQITPPTVQYLKKSRILFVSDFTIFHSFHLPWWISHNKLSDSTFCFVELNEIR